MRATLMPAASAASGFSPTARIARPKRRPRQQPPGDRHDDQERDVGQAVLVDDGADVAQAATAGSTIGMGSMRCSSAPVKQQPVGELRQADERDRQAQARHVLVGAQGHRQQAHDGARARGPPRWRRPGRASGVAGPEGDREAGEGARVHGALDAQVEDPAALRVRSRRPCRRRAAWRCAGWPPRRSNRKVMRAGPPRRDARSAGGGSAVVEPRVVRRGRTRSAGAPAAPTVTSSSVPCTTAPSWDGMPSARSAELAPTVRSPSSSAASSTPGMVSAAQHGDHDARCSRSPATARR